MVKAVVFDVNETLLQLNALDAIFQHDFGEGPAVREEWFLQALQSAFTATILGKFLGFEAHAQAALQMVAQRRNVNLKDSTKEAIKTGMTSLPPHPDVLESVKELKRAGYTVAVMTHNAREVVEAQMKNADLTEHFDAILTTADGKALKPSAKAYQYGLDQLGLKPSEVLLVAAHAWDVAGARTAGLKGAFVHRPGRVWDPTCGEADVMGQNMHEVVAGIKEKLPANN